MAEIGPEGSLWRLARAEPSQAHAIAAVHVASWRSAYAGIFPADYLATLSVAERSAMWLASIQRGTPEVWVAGDAQALEGFVAFGASRDPGAAPETGEIWALYLLETVWGRGLGRALCTCALHRLNAMGFREVSLWVLADNARARGFYASSGFCAEPESKSTFTQGGVELEEIRYRRSLADFA